FLTFIKIPEAECELVVIGIFCSDGVIDGIKLTVKRVEPATYHRLAVIISQGLLTYRIRAICWLRWGWNQQFIQVQSEAYFILLIKHFSIVCPESQIGGNKFLLRSIIGIPDF